MLFGHGAHGLHETSDHQHGPDTNYLDYYSGDLTDTDNDGMTDVAEIKYGYNPNSEQSFPESDFVVSEVEQVESYPVSSYEFAGLVVVKTESGISLVWNEPPGEFSWSPYVLKLHAGDKELYYGGHGWNDADINYENFSLEGNEILVGSFSETDVTNGNWLRNHPEFQIDLSEYPLEQTSYGDSSNEIKFKLTNFSDEQTEKYVDFIRRILPIMRDTLGAPSENFTCEFIMQDGNHNSWVTMDQGRAIYLDANWNPRLLVHELIHVWEGKLAFCWSGENREYSDDLSGFAEVAEGIAYKILHEYVMAYPTHYVSSDIANGGPWNNWSSDAWSYDLYKHQRFTGGGTYWTGDLRSVNHRYSTSAMLMQIILVQEPNFIKNMRAELFEIVNADDHILSRDEIVNLWANNIETINGIDTKTYLNAMPVFNGRKLDQGFYPIVNISGSYIVDIFSSYSVDGLFWWSSVIADGLSEDTWGNPISSLNLPEWVKYNYNTEDGYYYLDMNDIPYNLSISNINNEVLSSVDLRSSNEYQDPEKTIPIHLGETRVSDFYEVSPGYHPQGLYKYDVTYTDIIKFTEEASESFYFMGEQDISQNSNEVVLMFGVDSMFAESVNVTGDGLAFNLDVVNGCAVLKTSSIPLNKEMMLTINVSSHEETHTYKRALVHAGDSSGAYRQQFLIIDRDFDGQEDLYDSEVLDSYIESKYASYKQRHTDNDDATDNDDGNSTDTQPPVYFITDWDSATLVGNNWKHLDWFGYFYQSPINYNWTYHVNLGWLYIPGDSFDSVWMYSEKFGWMWTTDKFFPFVFIRDSGWVYFNFDQELYYDFNKQKYISLAQ